MPEEYMHVIETIVKAIVDRKEAVSIVKTVDEMGILLSLKVHKEDTGKIIGKEGNTAKALRTITRVIGMKSNARVSIKILEPENSFSDPTSNPLE